MNCTLIASFDELRTISRDWDRLAAASKFPNAFFSWGFNSAWWRAFCDVLCLKTIVVRRDNVGSACWIALFHALRGAHAGRTCWHFDTTAYVEHVQAAQSQGTRPASLAHNLLARNCAPGPGREVRAAVQFAVGDKPVMYCAIPAAPRGSSKCYTGLAPR
jgi:hypothetical protein